MTWLGIGNDFPEFANEPIGELQGVMDMKGAVHGANEKVVDFFKKSNLGTETLSRIWALSDVNEDGFLDLAEFSAAMHLIVLNLKVCSVRKVTIMDEFIRFPQ